ncbi:MAG: CoA pyrophosphatase [Myxococcota bacterium]|jgi:8-oxo-dGTP pyrophosphatase MutT (NUDIX family)|nr:CoA pyrophosphatase [Myxococcota bacterium]
MSAGLPAFPTAERLSRALQGHTRQDLPALEGRTNHLRCGVLVPICWEPEPTCLLTLRSRELRQHGGEVSFPGGRPEPEDRSLEHTALREAQEELGLRQVQVLGRLSSIPLFTSDFRIEPFVARVPPQPLRPQPSEVEQVLVQSLPALLTRATLDAIPFRLGEGHALSPIFVVDEHLVFGATAHVLLELLEVLAPLAGCPMPPLEPGRFQWSDVLPPEVLADRTL